MLLGLFLSYCSRPSNSPRSPPSPPRWYSHLSVLQSTLPNDSCHVQVYSSVCSQCNNHPQLALISSDNNGNVHARKETGLWNNRFSERDTETTVQAPLLINLFQFLCYFFKTIVFSFCLLDFNCPQESDTIWSARLRRPLSMMLPRKEIVTALPHIEAAFLYYLKHNLQ